MERLFLIISMAVWANGCGGSTNSGETDKVAKICNQLAALPCADSDEMAGCTTTLEQQRTAAAEEGCGAEFEAFLSCVAKGPMQCRPSGGKPFPESCDAASTVYDACESRMNPVCSASPVPSPETPCSTDCGVASATCTYGEPSTCTCTSGAHQGATFAIQTCEEIVEGVKQTCL